MGALSWIVIGLVAGAVARHLVRGQRRMGCLSTLAVGAIGAVLGGTLATWLEFGGILRFDLRSLLVATLGATLFLLLVEVARPQRTRRRRREED